MTYLSVELMDKNAIAPVCQHTNDAGFDLTSIENGVIPPRDRKAVSIGIKITVPVGTYGRIAPRSGLSLRNGIETGAGVIDRGYTGTVKVILYNHSDKSFEYKVGDRIAQLIIEVIENPTVMVVDSIMSVDDRKCSGFGSTG